MGTRRLSIKGEPDDDMDMDDVVMVQRKNERRFSSWDTTPIEGAEWQQGIADALQERPLFIEMVELTTAAGGHGGAARAEWRESYRWIKYEEAVEKDSNRWSKPYVASLQYPAIKTLRDLLESKHMNLGVSAQSLRSILGSTVDAWKADGLILESQRELILATLARRHVHLYERVKEYTIVDYVHPMNVKIKNRGGSRKQSFALMGGQGGGDVVQAAKERRASLAHRESSGSQEGGDTGKKNKDFMRKIPRGAEACNIMVGEVPGLREPVSAFLRMAEPKIFGNITEVPVPTCFIFILLVPVGQLQAYEPVGRALGAIMSDSNFKSTAYKAGDRGEIVQGVDAFMDGSTVLPPDGWDASIRIEPLASGGGGGHGGGDEGGEGHDPTAATQALRDAGLIRSGKLFGGLIQDIRRKLPWYLSDFRDALSPQCLATWLFLYFACLTPMITFGGILGQATDKYMGTMEVMVAGSLCGVVFALFSGQPLLILGSTGPMLIFEKIVIQVCKQFDLQYLEFRLWIGIWIAIILVILVAVDASFFVSYITRFTEENFATLVACIFIMEAFKNVIHIGQDPHHGGHGAAEALGMNLSDDGEVYAKNLTSDYDSDSDSPSFAAGLFNENGTLAALHHGDEFESPDSRQTIFLMSLLLFLGTFFISYLLKELRTSSFFPTFVRYLVSDFAVVLAIIIMATVDYLAGIDTPKLEVPTKFAPTIPDRGWLVAPFGGNPGWTVAAAAVPALLATILIFMDQQITAVIINRKDHKLKKGCGYHLDLFVLAILILVCSFLGLPWFIAATVESLTNLGSLKMESESAAPGEKPQFLGVREQRVSNLLIFITVGLSVLMTQFLQVVPMPVLYGVFLYMGFSALRKMELFERILLVFMPTKYQPDHAFLRVVPTVKVHIFTLIQVTSLALLWAIKSVKQTAILFPLMLLVMMVVRKLLEFLFTQKELAALDDLLPGASIHPGPAAKEGEKLLGNGGDGDHGDAKC